MQSQVIYARMGPQLKDPLLSQISCLLTLFGNHSSLNGRRKCVWPILIFYYEGCIDNAFGYGTHVN